MAQRYKCTERDFPAKGSIIVAPTSDGRFAACKVLRLKSKRKDWYALVATTTWLAKQAPPIEAKELRETLILTHHNWKNHREIFWVSDRMPADFKVIGHIELTAEESAEDSDSYGGWAGFPIQALMQWSWDHDREAMLLRESQAAAETARLNRERSERRAEMLRSLSLDSLLETTWFQGWEVREDTIPLVACRSSIIKLIDDLRIASETKLTQATAKRLLKESVLELNRLDSLHQFIATIEREDLFDAYEQIMCAAKFPLVVDQIDQWREW